MPIKTKLEHKLRQWYDNLPESQKSLLAALHLAFRNFLRDTIAGPASAGMAFYFVFSVFPLTMLVTVVMGHFVGLIFVQDEINLALGMFLPQDAVQLLLNTINGIIAQQETFGIAALLGLAWAGLGLLGEVTRVLDVIFHAPNPHTLFQQRVLAVIMVMALTVLLGGLIVILGLLRLITVFSFNHTWRWLFVALRMTPVSMNVLLFMLLFRYIPNCEVNWDAVLPASILGGFGWEAIRLTLNWYISSVGRFSFIYGGLSVVMVLMLWAYAGATVFLLSAEVCARLNDWIASHPHYPHMIQTE
ncbi:MAG: YihY/virulence factor BrkB family protein [Anaerolineae bacterium]|nr:YihY/virulence factor BrkB family protein [Anaerolineae bacterium]